MKIALYPYDFESISLMKNRNMLNGCEISCLVAPQGFGLSGKDAYYLYGEKSGYDVKSKLETEDYDNTDILLITDSIMKMPFESRMDGIQEMLKSCKSVISIVHDSSFCAGLKEICGKCGVEWIESVDFINGAKQASLNEAGLPSERNRINTPIIAVCGMAPMTQKFDLQLYFRNYLLQDGYKVSQIGTRKSSHLFGFHSWDETLYGNAYTEMNKILKINQFVKDIESIENPDVFVIGIPDALVSYTHKHTFSYGIYAFEIFNAIAPDFTVMSLFNGEYTDEFYKEMTNLCNYKFNVDVDCFYNSCFVPTSLSINAANLSYSYVGKKSFASDEYQIFNEDSLANRKLYNYMITCLTRYGNFKAY